MKSFACTLAFISSASALAVPFLNTTNITVSINVTLPPLPTLPTPSAFDSSLLTPVLSSRQAGNETNSTIPVNNSTIPINSTHVPPPPADVGSKFHPVRALDVAGQEVDPVAVLRSLMQSGSVDIGSLPAQLQAQLQSFSSLPASDALATLQRLMSSGAININSLPPQLSSQLQSITSLSNIVKRQNLALLNCGYDAATNCALFTAGTLQQCMWQAIGGARDAKNDAECTSAANAMGAALPADCKTCLGL